MQARTHIYDRFEEKKPIAFVHLVLHHLVGEGSWEMNT